MTKRIGQSGLEQVDVVEPAVVAGGTHDPRGRHLAVLDQCLLHGLDRERFEADGQLDHVLGGELLGRNMSKDVARRFLARRGRRKFENAGRTESREGVEGEGSAGVVGFVHDHDRAAETENVGQGIGHGAVLCFFEHRQRGGIESREVMVERTGAVVHLPAFFVVNAKGLERAYNHHGLRVERGLGGVKRLRGFEDFHGAEFGLERLPVVVRAIAQRGEGLRLDRARGNEPEDAAVLLLEKFAMDDGDGETSQERLASTGRETQAHIRHALKLLRFEAGGIEVGQTHPRALAGELGERRCRSAESATATQKLRQRLDGLELVEFGSEHALNRRRPPPRPCVGRKCGGRRRAPQDRRGGLVRRSP